MSEIKTQEITSIITDDINGSIGRFNYTFIDVRYSVDGEERKLKIEIPLDSDWEHLTHIIENSLGCDESVINSLTMVGGKDGMRSPPLTTAVKFWKFFSYYNYEQDDFFEVQLSKPLTFHENKLSEEIMNTIHIEEITSPIINQSACPDFNLDNIPTNNENLLPEIMASQIDILPTQTGSIQGVENGEHHEKSTVEIPSAVDSTSSSEIQYYPVTSIPDEIISANVGNGLADSLQQSVQSSQPNSSPIQATNAASSPDLDGAMKSVKVILRCSYTDTNTRNSIVSDITVNRLCPWNELTETITETIFQKTAKIHSFLLVDSDGDQLSELLTTAEIFWKTYQKNRHNKKDTSFQIDYTIIVATADEVKKVAREDMKEVAKARARKKIEDDIRQRAMEREKDKINQIENSPGKGSPVALTTTTTTDATTVATKSNLTQNGKHDHTTIGSSNGKGNPLLRTPPRKSNTIAKASVESTTAAVAATAAATTPPTRSSTALTAKEKIAEDIRLRALERGKEKQKRLSGVAALSPEKVTVTTPTATTTTPLATTNVTLTPTIHAMDENGIISPSSSTSASKSESQTPKTPPRISKYSPATTTWMPTDTAAIDTTILNNNNNQEQEQEPTGASARPSSLGREERQPSSSGSTDPDPVTESFISSHPVSVTVTVTVTVPVPVPVAEVNDDEQLQPQQCSDEVTYDVINDSSKLPEEAVPVESFDTTPEATASNQLTYKSSIAIVSSMLPFDNNNDTASDQSSIHIIREDFVVVDGHDKEDLTTTITPTPDPSQTETRTNILSEEVVSIAVENIEICSEMEDENDVKSIDEREDISKNLTVESWLLSDITASTIATYENNPTASSIVTYDNNPTDSTISTDDNNPTASTIATYDNNLTACTIATYDSNPTASTITTYDDNPTASTITTYDNNLTASTITTYDNNPTASTITTYDSNPTASTITTYDNNPTASTITTYDSNPTASTITTYDSNPTASTITTYDSNPTASTITTYDSNPTASTITTNGNTLTASTIATDDNNPTSAESAAATTTATVTATMEDESTHFLDISNASSSNTNTSNISTASSSSSSSDPNKFSDNLENPNNIDNNNIIINEINDFTMTNTTSDTHSPSPSPSSLSTIKEEEHHYPTQKVHSFPFYLNDDITTEINILISMTMTWNELLERLSTFFSLATSNNSGSDSDSGSTISHLILQDLDYDDVSPQLRNMEKFLKFIKKYQSGDAVKIQVHTVTNANSMTSEVENDATATATATNPAIESSMEDTTVSFTSDKVLYSQPLELDVAVISTSEPSTDLTTTSTAAAITDNNIEIPPVIATLSIEEIMNLKANFLKACGDGDLALATNLFHQGKSYEVLDAIDSKGMTALHYACDGMHSELALFLIDSGANIFLEDASGLTPLHCICLQGLLPLSHLLTADTITLKSTSGLTLLHCASNGGHEDILQQLLKYDNNVHNKDREGLTPLHHACLNGHLSTAKILVENNASINSRDLSGMSPLLYACSEGRLAIVEWLIEIGANVHAKNNFGDGALHIASQGGFKEVVQFLLASRQMKTEEKNNNNETASDVARSRHHLEIVELISQYGGGTAKGTSIDVLELAPTDVTGSTASTSEAPGIDQHAIIDVIPEVVDVDVVSVESHPAAAAAAVEETPVPAVTVSECHDQQPKEIPTVTIYSSTLSTAEKQIFRLTDVQSYSPSDSPPELLADKELLFRYCCYNGDTLKVESMLTEGFDVNNSTTNGTNPLHYACAGGHFDTAYILVHHGAKINRSNHDGCTALHFSCYFQHDDISIWLLEQGSNINIKNKHGYSPLYLIYSLNQLHLLRIIMNDLKGVVPLEFEKNKSLLHLIVQFNYKEMVTLVVQSGYGNATSVDDELSTPLHYACQYGQLEIVQYLILNYGASINNKDSLGNNALFRACASGNTNLIEWLVQEGASLQGTDYAGNTCLHVASRAGKLAVVEWLLRHEVNPLLKNNDGNSARDLALRFGFEDIYSLLPFEEEEKQVSSSSIEESNLTITSTSQPLAPIVEEETENENEEYFGAQPRQEDNEDRSDPFVQFKHLCVEGNMDAVVHAIQVDGVNPNLTNKKGSTALHFLSLSGNLKLCRKLVELGASPNKANDRGLTPLLCACINGHLAVVKWLAQQPDVTLTDISEDGRSALHHGCYNGHVNITEWLLKENIDVNIYSREGNLAFHDACIAGHVPVVSSLINYGVNVSTINQYGFAPVTLAMEQGHLDVVKILVINGADVNAVDNHNRTIFLYACGKGFLDFAQWLVRTSKEVNTRAVGGVSDKLNTGLHTAVKYGHLEMIKWLLEIGLDVNALNEKQQTPIAISNAYQYFEISKLLIVKRFSIYEDFRNYSKFPEFQVALKTINLPVMNDIISEFAVKIKSVFNLIHYAAATGNVSLVSLLIEKKEYVNCKTNMGHTPLHYAAVKDHSLTARKLLEFGADLEERDLEGCTPLVLAMYAGNAEVSKLLFNTKKKEFLDMAGLVATLSAGSDKRSTKNSKSSKVVKNPILRAIAFAKGPMKGCTAADDDNDLESTSVMSIFSCITSRSNKEESPLPPPSTPVSPVPAKQHKHLEDSPRTSHSSLVTASQRHIRKLFEIVEEEGGVVDEFDFSGPPLSQAMITACQSNDLESLRYFVSQGVNVNLRNPSNASTFLHFASMRGHLAIVEYLIEEGAQVNLRNIAGMSPLHIACERRHGEMILLLVRHGADVMIRNRAGETPLHCLCARGLGDVFREVLSIATSEDYLHHEKIKIEVITNKGLTLLHTAVEYGAVDVVVFLLSLQVEVNPVDDENRAPIHFACLKGNLAITELLWDRGASINARDTKGRTPFLYACVGGHLPLMEWLCERGADANAMTDAGNNALHAACRLGDLDMVRWLVEKGVDSNHQNRQNVTPKQCALEAGKLDVIHWLENGILLPVGQEINLRVVNYCGSKESAFYLPLAQLLSNNRIS